MKKLISLLLIAKLFPIAFPPIVSAAIVAATVNETIIGLNSYVFIIIQTQAFFKTLCTINYLLKSSSITLISFFNSAKSFSMSLARTVKSLYFAAALSSSNSSE